MTQVLLDVTGEEFETLMEVLSRLTYITTEEGSQQVASLISDQAELNTDFEVSVPFSLLSLTPSSLLPSLSLSRLLPPPLSLPLSPPPPPSLSHPFLILYLIHPGVVKFS